MTRRPAIWLILALCAVAILDGRQPAPGRYERPIATAGRGPQKLRIDVPLLAAGRPFTVSRSGEALQARGGLADLRLFDRRGGEVGYLLANPPERRTVWRSGVILPVAETRKTSGFEVDFGAARAIDALDVQGLPPPFLKRLALEASGDRTRWTVLAREGTLLDLPAERVRQTTIEFAPGAYRYLRVTWDDTNSGRLPAPRRVSARDAAARPPAAPLRSLLTFQKVSSEPGRSRYRIPLPGTSLPIVALAIDAGDVDVFRTGTVIESRFSGTRADPVELGRARLVQTGRSAGAPATLRIPVEPPRGSELQLAIDDGSNPPLTIDRIEAEFAELPWIYFEAPDAGPLIARYGHASARAPQYDLEARRAAVKLDALPEATWGDAMPASPEGGRADAVIAPPRGAAIDTAAFRYRRTVPEGPGGLVALQLDAAVLSHSRGPDGGFRDVRLTDAEGFQVPYLLERRDEPLALDLALRPASTSLPQPAAGSRSAYAMDLPYPHLPGSRLVLETSERVFRRPVQLGVERPPDRQHRDRWLEVLAAAVWQHADQATPASPLELSIAPGAGTGLVLFVDEGDNRPLPIAAARLLLPSWRLRFFRPARRLQLVYGREDLDAPQYDLSLLASAVMGADAAVIDPGAEAGAESTRPVLSPRLFWIALGVAAAVLLALIVKLIASGTEPPPAPPGP